MVSEYVPTIGLEIHAELRTATKMFCRSKNDTDEKRPNVNVCPVCMAHPGVLPVINKDAVRHVLRVGTALGGTVADYTEFDRKNYFYPDLPKGYQLSQYEYPLVTGGVLHGIPITRVHLEEDTASSMHEEGSETTIDYNRAGIPLMELVTEPAIRSAGEAGAFARELQLLLRYLSASDANMEKGEMRVEANVSVSAGKRLGTKVEIKNLNSFRAMERAIAYEITRQKKILEGGKEVAQETLGWDEHTQKTFAQRTKEGSADYRYFPDPDLPSLKLSDVPEFNAGVLRNEMPELPWRRRERYISLGVKEADAELYVREPSVGVFFEEVISASGGDAARIRLASNYIVNDLMQRIRDTQERDTVQRAEIKISSLNFSKIIAMLADRKITSRAAKDILAEAIASGNDPEDIAVKRGLYLSSAGADLDGVVALVLEGNTSVVEDFKSGKAAALEFLVGQAMKASQGAADPVVLRELIQRKISL